MTPEPDSFSRYRILGSLGSGGMGTVYLAEDTRLGRRVAIKCLREGFDGESARKRFHREARAIASLHHPNIVNIFDFGEHQDAPYIVMEYVEGETLREMISQRRPVPLAYKLEIFEAICAGLAHAHQAGIIHRDIKPGNLIVGAPGVVKILDFGIARTPGTPLTDPNAFLGSPNYMAPEQVLGQEIDHRADIFAVAAALYETITYRQAFPGDVAEATHRILSATPVPIGRLSTEVDSQIERIVMRGLSRNPNQRFPGISQMQKELARARSRLQETGHGDEPGGWEPSPEVLHQSPELVPRQTDSRARRVVVSVGAVALLIAGVLFGVWARTRSSDVPAQPATETATAVATERSSGTEDQRPGGAKPRSRSPAGPPSGTTTPPAQLGSQPESRPQPYQAAPRKAEGDSEPNLSPPGAASGAATVSSPASLPAPPAASPSTADSAGRQADNSGKEIDEVLRRYERAHAAMDIAALKQLQPSLTVDEIRGITRSFLDLTAYALTVGQPAITISGRKARVDCTITRELVPLKGEPRRIANRTMIQLEKLDESWVITSVIALR